MFFANILLKMIYKRVSMYVKNRWLVDLLEEIQIKLYATQFTRLYLETDFDS